MNCKVHKFVARGGQVIEDGRSSYPNLLRVRLIPSDAWRVLRQLVNDLDRQYYSDKSSLKDVEIDLLGELTEEEE